MAASAGTVRTADGVLPWTKANNICQYAKVQILFFSICKSKRQIYCTYTEKGRIQKYSKFSNEIWKIYIFLFLGLFFCCHKRIGMLESLVTKLQAMMIN